MTVQPTHSGRAWLVVVTAAGLLMASGMVTAQSNGPQGPVDVSTLPRFDVVSVKPNTSGGGLPSFPALTPGHVTWRNVGLRQLIQLSHSLQRSQLVGLPPWAETARFDISATAPTGTSLAQMLLMVRGLLADRFQFVGRREVRPLDVYTLVQAAPGTSGNKLRRSTVDCAAANSAPLDQSLAAQRGNGPRCQILPMVGRGRVLGTGIRMTDLANVLTGVVGRVVVDRTGLTDSVDLDLAWTPDRAPQPGSAPAAASDPSQAPSDAPSIFTAVQEQLGLRLVPARVPVEVLVVEHLEPSTAD